MWSLFNNSQIREAPQSWRKHSTKKRLKVSTGVNRRLIYVNTNDKAYEQGSADHQGVIEKKFVA
jgi:hypothetical protein